MSYEHCEKHDCDATNGCLQCEQEEAGPHVLVLGTAADDLNDAFVRAATAFRKKFKVSACIPLTTESELFWGKQNGNWGFWVNMQGSSTASLLSSSLEIRVLAARKLETLYLRLRDSNNRHAEAVVKAAGLVNDLVNRMEGT